MIGKLNDGNHHVLRSCITCYCSVFARRKRDILPFFENANLYIRNLRNVHAPAFHQTYDNYLQLFHSYFYSD